MEIDDFMEQILMLKDKELEQKVWEIWLVCYPSMTENTFESYEEMLNRTKQCEVTKNQEAQHGLYIDQVFF
jgi:wyosine [tRNA(Phe)-imidazoG37] synthetase (radical SAM superfamily)